MSWLRVLLAPLTCVFLVACGGEKEAERTAERRPEHLAPPASSRYIYGTEILFGESGGETPYLKDGWSFPEKGLRWTEGSQAGLGMGVPVPQGSLVLRVSFATALTAPGRLEWQRVVVSANGTRLSEWQVKEEGTHHEATIPKGLLSSGSLMLRFELPDATEPRNLIASSDSRKLGVAFHSLSLQGR